MGTAEIEVRTQQERLSHPSKVHEKKERTSPDSDRRPYKFVIAVEKDAILHAVGRPQQCLLLGLLVLLQVIEAARRPQVQHRICVLVLIQNRLVRLREAIKTNRYGVADPLEMQIGMHNGRRSEAVFLFRNPTHAFGRETLSALEWSPRWKAAYPSHRCVMALDSPAWI